MSEEANQAVPSAETSMQGVEPSAEGANDENFKRENEQEGVQGAEPANKEQESGTDAEQRQPEAGRDAGEPGKRPYDDFLSSDLTADDDKYDRSIKEDVVYETTEDSQFRETRALFIGNLRPPFLNSDLQNMLDAEASQAGCSIDRLWLNEHRSHCIAIISDISGAVAIRKKFNGRPFPSGEVKEGEEVEDISGENEKDEKDEKDGKDGKEVNDGENAEDVNDVNDGENNGENMEGIKETNANANDRGKTLNDNLPEQQSKQLPLYIDFIPVKATQLWIDQEGRGPKDAVWKVSYMRLPPKREGDPDFLVVAHKMLNYPNRSLGYKSKRDHRSGVRHRRGGFRRRYREREYYRGVGPAESSYRDREAGREPRDADRDPYYSGRDHGYRPYPTGPRYGRERARDRDYYGQEGYRGYDRDYGRGYRDYDRSYGRSYDRSTYERSTDRNYDRNADRSYDRSTDRNYDRGTDRNYDRGYDRSPRGDYDRREYDRRPYDREEYRERSPDRSSGRAPAESTKSPVWSD